MPLVFSDQEIQTISNALMDICIQNKIPCFVFSFPLDPEGENVISFIGRQDPECEHIFIIDVTSPND